MEELATKSDLLELEARLEVRFYARVERLQSALTRRMIAILGAWTVIVASAFAGAGAIFA